MLPIPRIIAIDDNPEHLAGLVRALNQTGVGCLPYKFEGDGKDIVPCPDVRIIFADLHLNDSGTSTADAQHFGVIGGLLQDNITPIGLYCIILWTRFPNKAADLRKFLAERLKKVPAPFIILALDKMDFLQNGTIEKISELVIAIKAIVESQPQLSALLNWEEKVLSAAGATISSILTMIPPQPGADPAELGRILARLAVEAVGLEHVEKDRFQAVNESLLPILADRITNIVPGKSDAAIWKKAFPAKNLEGPLSPDEAARLNTFMHVDVQGKFTPLSRGAVSLLPDSIKAIKFKKICGLDFKTAAISEFKCEGYESGAAGFRWVVVQAQASCDFAQNQSGTLPFYLGLEMPADKKSKEKAPGSIWTGPVFDAGGLKLLRISARFPVTLGKKEASKATKVYRLREQLLNDLTYHIHVYGARPGMISFHEVKGKGTKDVPAKSVSKDAKAKRTVPLIKL